VDVERAELDEMVARPAAAELAPGDIAEARRDRVGGPGRIVQHGVLARHFPLAARAEAGLLFQHGAKAVASLVEDLRRGIEDGHAHPAGDVHADGIGDHAVVCGQHAANRQAVALVRVGHQRAAHRHRQPHRALHLFERALLDLLGAPHFVGRGGVEIVAGRALAVPLEGGQRLGHPAIDRVVQVISRGAEHLGQIAQYVLLGRTRVGCRLGRLQRQTKRFAGAKAELKQIVAVHGPFLSNAAGAYRVISVYTRL